MRSLDFTGLSDRERSLLTSRNSGAVQVAAKGTHRRSSSNEHWISNLLNSKAQCRALAKQIRSREKPAACKALTAWLDEQGIRLDRACLYNSVSYLYRNNLYSWTGVYLAADQKHLITLVRDGLK